MRVLLLGGYGLIGKEIGRCLLAAGHEVVAAARNPDLGRRLLPAADWLELDLNNPIKSENWERYLRNCDAVVNAAGALQSGGGDSLARSQRDNLLSLFEACTATGVTCFVQISAPGASETAETEFLRTKGEADAALAGSALDWVILKPGLVIAATAFGGTALLRSLAAVPWVQPLLLPRARFQCIGADDLARSVLACLEDGSLRGRRYDLMEAEAHSLRDIVLSLRRWLGFPPPRAVIALPLALGLLLAKLADLAALLGWRTPLRSTAIRLMARDVVGDPGPWLRAGGTPLKSLREILASLPASRQERVFARHQLIFPFAMLGLQAFWLASGLIGLARTEAASGLLQGVMTDGQAQAAVVAGALLDLAVGLLLLFRRWFRLGCLLAIAVSLGYLLLASLLLPALWLDPLGALVKVVPALLLAASLALLAEER